MISHYYLTSSELLLKNAYPNLDETPQSILDIDKEEQIALDKEQEVIRGYSKSKITAIKVSMVVFGVGIGIIASMLTVPFLPFDVDAIAYAGVFIGAIFGYILGIFYDNQGASERLAIYHHRITPLRIERMTKKLQQLSKLIEENSSSNHDKINIAKTHVEKCLKEKGSYNRVYELLNINL